MWPFIYENAANNLKVATYGVTIILAFSAACLFIHLRAQRHGFNPDHLVHSYVAAIVGGIIGARVFTAFTVDIATTLSNPTSLFSMNGLTYYGGVLGGLLAMIIAAHLGGFLSWTFFDLVAPALIIGHTIGRMGCFFAGCCHGSPVALSDDAFPILDSIGLNGSIWIDYMFPFMALEFNGGAARYLDAPLYPTQLWSVCIGFFLVVVLVLKLRHKRFDGEVLALTLIAEPVSRFLVELYRGDARGVGLSIQVSQDASSWFPGLSHATANGITGFTTSQIVGVLMCASGCIIWWIQKKESHRSP